MGTNSTIADPTPSTIAKAARLLREGRLVAFPTETVYGLGADATSDAAVASIFAAKGRPQFNPLIVHLTDVARAEAIGVFDARARLLASAFWPGALTLVVPRRQDCGVSWLASAGLETIALRCPANPIAHQLLQAFGGPVAAPSANRSGMVTSTTARHVADSFGESVELIVDGGATTLGLESTIIGLVDDVPTMFRPGAIAREDIEAVCGPLGVALDRDDAPHSPGRLKSHYAPAKPIRLNATAVRGDEGLLAFGMPIDGARRTLNLSASGNLKEAAANLFAMLRALDAGDVSGIAVMGLPSRGLGEAINDRLQRAAAPKDMAG